MGLKMSPPSSANKFIFAATLFNVGNNKKPLIIDLRIKQSRVARKYQIPDMELLNTV